MADKRWLKEETRRIRNYIRDVINYLKKGFSLELGICLVTWYMPIRNSQGQIHLQCEKIGKKLKVGNTYPFYQPIRRHIHI